MKCETCKGFGAIDQQTTERPARDIICNVCGGTGAVADAPAPEPTLADVIALLERQAKTCERIAKTCERIAKTLDEIAYTVKGP